ncbi:uncharacterized protein LOC120351366 [Nilaparvata lugens]|uniref:uncharacterized protein LOC120351366 n=1 Tax=Nilaparvata lugens TaxID=108931 RepID=UPI00193D16E4|nr:uncharacterized protein LOC120351366 [Nilaparvata lugens]
MIYHSPYTEPVHQHSISPQHPRFEQPHASPMPKDRWIHTRGTLNSKSKLPPRKAGCVTNRTMSNWNLGLNTGRPTGGKDEKSPAKEVIAPMQGSNTIRNASRNQTTMGGRQHADNTRMKYFKDEWMRKVTPHAFSVFGQKNRTNNCQETLNRNINRTIVPQGNTWDFWEGLLALSVKEINYHDQLSRGLECARPKKKQVAPSGYQYCKVAKKICG